MGVAGAGSRPPRPDRSRASAGSQHSQRRPALRGNAPVALITGAGRGIGRATAEAFAAEGYTVILAERLSALGKRAEQALVRAGARALFLRTDVASQASVQHTVAAVTRRFGRLDCLVNNAGVLSVGPLARLSVRDLDRMLAVNLRGSLLMARAALPAMLRQGTGAIINVASQLGKYGLGEYVTYCATKFGVVGFTEALASELSGTGIRVWAVCPGLTDTPMALKTGVSPVIGDAATYVTLRACPGPPTSLRRRGRVCYPSSGHASWAAVGCPRQPAPCHGAGHRAGRHLPR